MASLHLSNAPPGRPPEFRYAELGGGASGPWEQIFYGEFDGRRDKRVLIKIIGG